MWTFGLAMLIANLSFVSPWLVRRIIDRRPSAPAAVGQKAVGSAPANARISNRRQRV
jgi:hypothetical protein